MSLALRRRGDADRDAAVRADGEDAALDVARLGEGRGALGGRLRKRDVAHVRDRRLDDAGDAEAEPPARGLLGPPLVVADELERLLETGEVVAGVVDGAARGRVREVGHEVAPPQLRRIESEASRRDVHRPLEREVQLRPAEPPVETRGTAIGHHDPVARRDVADAVGAGQRAVHPVERRRLRRADVRPDVLERVVAQAEQLAIGRERRLEAGHASRRMGARRQVLEAILGPADRHAEHARDEAQQDDVHVHGRLDPERAARVGRGQQAQLGGGDPEGGGRDAVQREGSLEVRPRRQAVTAPVRDDAVALDGRARPPRELEAAFDDDVRSREGLLRGAVREVALVHLDLLDRERLVLHLDELGSVLGDVARLRDDDRDRLAHVTRRAVRGGVVRGTSRDSRRQRARHADDLLGGHDADDAGQLERGGDIDRADVGVGERRSDDRRVAGVRDGLDVVHEAPVTAQERLVLDPRDRLPDERLRGGRAHLGTLRRASTICSGVGPPWARARNAVRAARGSFP